METIDASISKANRIKAELAELLVANKKREAQKRALLQRVTALEQKQSRKDEAHAKYCLGGAILKYKPEYADEMLAALTTDPKAPKGHAGSVRNLLDGQPTTWKNI